MTSLLGLVSNTNAILPNLPLSADFLGPNGHSDNAFDIQSKSPDLLAYNTPVLPSSLLPLLLQYLLPPSPAGLPPHLLSRALSSRHLYLSIDPSEDMEAYYTLSPASATAVKLLKDIGAYHRAEDGFDSIAGRIGYVAERGYDVDGASEVMSFVQLRFEGRELWVVLVWEEGEWKYTDIRPGPLLEMLSSTPTLAINSARSGRKTKATGKATKVVIQTRSASDSDDSDDDYWARYGANSDSEDESGVPRNGLTPFEKKGKGKKKTSSSGTRSVNEEVYWAQYGTGDVTTSPTIGHGATLMPVQRQHDSITDGDQDGHEELRASIKQAFAQLPISSQPGAPKPRMLNLDLTSPTFHPAPSNDQAQPDTNTSSISSSAAHLGPHTHSVLTGGIAQGLALDLNTPPPTEPKLSIASMLPTMASPISTMVPTFATGSGSNNWTNLQIVGIGSPAVGAVERSLVAAGGSVGQLAHVPGEPGSLLDVLMRERGSRRASATAYHHADRTAAEESTKRRAEEDAARFEGDEAVLQSVRGIFRMWRVLRGTTRDDSATDGTDDIDTNWDVEGANEAEEKHEFLSLVGRALADL